MIRLHLTLENEYKEILPIEFILFIWYNSKLIGLKDVFRSAARMRVFKVFSRHAAAEWSIL